MIHMKTHASLVEYRVLDKTLINSDTIYALMKPSYAQNMDHPRSCKSKTSKNRNRELQKA